MIENKRQNQLLTNPESYTNWSMPVVGQALVKPNKTNELVDEVKKIKADAYQEAYQAGRLQAATDIDNERNKLLLSAKLLQYPLTMIDDALKELLVDCVVFLTQQCLMAELRLDKIKIQNVVDKMLASLDEKSLDTKVFLHPNDLQTINECLDEKAQQNQIRYFPDANLSMGEARVETPHCSIDATVRNRMLSACSDILLPTEKNPS